MDKPDVSSLLGELEPTTEYGEFLKLWPDIKETLDRQVKLNAIYQKLKDANLVTVSYVTFTRFVKKVSDESEGDRMKATPARKAAAGKAGADNSAGTQQAEPASSNENADKSATVATPVADAKKNAIQASTQKNYSKNVRDR